MSPFQHRNPAIQVPPLQQQQPQQFGVPYDMNGYGYPAGQQGGYYYGPSDGYRDRFYKTPFLRKTFKINLHYQFLHKFPAPEMQITDKICNLPQSL
jgi:hypothetical protein